MCAADGASSAGALGLRCFFFSRHRYTSREERKKRGERPCSFFLFLSLSLSLSLSFAAIVRFDSISFRPSLAPSYLFRSFHWAAGLSHRSVATTNEKLPLYNLAEERARKRVPKKVRQSHDFANERGKEREARWPDCGEVWLREQEAGGERGEKRSSPRRARRKGTKLISEALTNYFLRKGVGYLQLSFTRWPVSTLCGRANRRTRPL